ncbi:hypothetical protein KSP39_PZI012914 [Platanthera zijinensis]|uniref:UBX domain-containing protein n=1 Tax=Platanthera zijinensis TaxID=2320716 RepID=A0AAP0G2Z6_9ASPA
MTSKDEYLVSKFLKITTTCCRDFTSNILKDKQWNIKSAIRTFFECGSRHKESVALPLNPPSDVCSTSETFGLGSSEDEVNESQEDNIFDYAIEPTDLSSKGGIEAAEGQEHFTFDSCTEVVDQALNDENVVGDGQKFLCFDYYGITPTGWGSEDDDKEAEEFQEQDGFEHGPDYGTMSESNSSGWLNEDSVWEEELHETNLSTLDKLTTRFMYHGSFYEAKRDASHSDRWLLVSVQSFEQFTSAMLNRETNDTVEEILSSHFVIWQTDDGHAEGQKVCYFYNLISLPAMFIINPITGEKMCACRCLNKPEDFLEDLLRFTDSSPRQQLNPAALRENANALAHQTDEEASEEEEAKERSDVVTEKPIYPPLPEEPTEKKLICKVGICLPSGKRVHRSFLKTDSTKLLWSFCSCLLEEEESRRFWFMVPSSPKLFYDQETSFEEAGLSSALLRLCFEEEGN